MESFSIGQQLREMVKLAWITSATQFLIILPSLMSVPIAGKLDKESLDAAGMGFAIINFSAYSVIIGLSMSSETLFSQVYGSENRSSLGIIAQRGLVIKILAGLLVGSVLFHTESLLLLLGQDHQLAFMTGQFISGSLPGYVLAFPILLTEMKYLQAQKIVKPCLISGLLSIILYIGYIAALVFGLNLGVLGCGISISLTLWTWTLILLLYIRMSHVFKDTWSGFQIDALRDWKTFLKYGLPGIAMIQVEMMCFETYTILAGLLGPIQLSCHIILSIVVNFCYHISYGMSTAVTVQVGNWLGGGHFQNARSAAKISLIVAVSVALIDSLILLATHNYIPYIFSSDSHVISAARPLLLMGCAELIVDVTMTIETGILRAQGKQFFGAVVNVVCLGVVAIPLGVYLMFWTNLGVFGCWIAITVGLFFQTFTYSVKIYRTDWEKEALEAQENAGVEKSSDDSCDSSLATSDSAMSSSLNKETTPLASNNTELPERKLTVHRIIQIAVVLLICVSSLATSVYNSSMRHNNYNNSSTTSGI